MLQLCQNLHGYISEEDVRQIARFIKVSETHVYAVASFYAQFRFRKPGEKLIRVCMGTACHVQGGEQLSQEIQNQLGIRPGETTPDFALRLPGNCLPGLLRPGAGGRNRR